MIIDVFAYGFLLLMGCICLYNMRADQPRSTDIITVNFKDYEGDGNGKYKLVASDKVDMTYNEWLLLISNYKEDNPINHSYNEGRGLTVHIDKANYTKIEW